MNEELSLTYSYSSGCLFSPRFPHNALFLSASYCLTMRWSAAPKKTTGALLKTSCVFEFSILYI